MTKKFDLKIFGFGTLLFFFTVSFYFWWWGPRVPRAEGLGWDGLILGSCAADLVGCIKSGQVGFYHMHRLLPSAFVNIVFQMFSLAATAKNIILVFNGFNFLVILLSAALWWKICLKSGLSVRMFFLGCGLYYYNFAVFRLPYYAGVSTDPFALFLAMLCLWLYVNNFKMLGLFTFLPGAFTWPAAPVIISSVFTLSENVQKKNFLAKKMPRPLNAMLLAIGLAGFLAASLYYLYDYAIENPSGEGQYIIEALPLSYLFVLGYLLWIARINALQNFLARVSIHWVRLIVVLGMLAFLKMIDHSLIDWALPNGPSQSALVVIRRMLTEGVVYPAHFIVSHSVFYGAGTLLLIKEFPKILKFTAEEHLPLFLVTSMGALFFLSTESRNMTFCIPFLGFALCHVLKDRFSNQQVGVFLVTCLVFSKFWMPMATGPFSDYRAGGLVFPAQILFMNIGPWMSETSWAIGVLQTFICLAVLIYMYRPSLSAKDFWENSKKAFKQLGY